MTLIQTSDTLVYTPHQHDQSAVATAVAEHTVLEQSIQLPPLPLKRPLLMVGHGTRNPQGRQTLRSEERRVGKECLL